MKGVDEAGKTFLGNILFSSKVASTLPTDSGVGQLALRMGHKVSKVDDSGHLAICKPLILMFDVTIQFSLYISDKRKLFFQVFRNQTKIQNNTLLNIIIIYVQYNIILDFCLVPQTY